MNSKVTVLVLAMTFSVPHYKMSLNDMLKSCREMIRMLILPMTCRKGRDALKKEVTLDNLV